MVLGKESAPKCVLGIVSWLGGGVVEDDSLKSREFLIISRKKSISPLCLACIAATAVAIVDVTAFVIDCWKEEFMT